MSELYQSLSHSRWDCKDHVIFVPKRRGKVVYGQARRQLGAIFHALAHQNECRIIEEHLMPDHVHMCIAIPPKHPVASVIGFLRGKRSITIARQLCSRERKFTGEHFWARGYAVSTVGSNSIKSPANLREQLTRIDQAGSSESWSKACLSATLKPKGQLPLWQSNSSGCACACGRLRRECHRLVLLARPRVVCRASILGIFSESF